MKVGRVQFAVPSSLDVETSAKIAMRVYTAVKNNEGHWEWIDKPMVVGGRCLKQRRTVLKLGRRTIPVLKEFPIGEYVYTAVSGGGVWSQMRPVTLDQLKLLPRSNAVRVLMMKLALTGNGNGQ